MLRYRGTVVMSPVDGAGKRSDAAGRADEDGRKSFDGQLPIARDRILSIGKGLLELLASGHTTHLLMLAGFGDTKGSFDHETGSRESRRRLSSAAGICRSLTNGRNHPDRSPRGRPNCRTSRFTVTAANTPIRNRRRRCRISPCVHPHVRRLGCVRLDSIAQEPEVADRLHQRNGPTQGEHVGDQQVDDEGLEAGTVLQQAGHGAGEPPPGPRPALGAFLDLGLHPVLDNLEHDVVQDAPFPLDGVDAGQVPAACVAGLDGGRLLDDGLAEVVAFLQVGFAPVPLAPVLARRAFSSLARSILPCVRSISRSRPSCATALITSMVILLAELVRARQWTRVPIFSSFSTVMLTSIASRPSLSSFVTTSRCANPCTAPSPRIRTRFR